MDKNREKPGLLFISPVIPERSSSGPQMRAYFALRELSHHHEITLLVVLDTFISRDTFPNHKIDFCHRQIIVSKQDIFPVLYRVKKGIDMISPLLSRILLFRSVDWLTAGNRIFKKVESSLSMKTFETIHLFRFRMYPLVKKCRQREFNRKVNLDLDDIESMTKHRISALYKANRNLLFLKSSFESEFYRRKEKKLLKHFNKVFVCSPEDKTYLEARYRLNNVELAPNVIDLPVNTVMKNPEKPGRKNEYTFMFVGSLSYYPNRDAMLYFCSDILPLISKSTSVKINLMIIGSGAGKRFQKKLQKLDGVQIKGYVRNLGSFYHKTDSVIVPIRAGGGTRIKIIEAFSYGKPVVATTVGAEGLSVRDNDNILLADSKEIFAEKCLHLINCPAFGKTIGKRGYLTVKRKYAFGTLTRFSP
jgi:glycosyltransferase involved in cell wall biosynthesis